MRAALDRRYRPAGHHRPGPNGEPLEAFDIILRGGTGQRTRLSQAILRRVPSAMVEDYVSRLFGSYLERREASETFAHFCVRSSDEDLISIASGNVINRRRCRRLNPGIAPRNPPWQQHRKRNLKKPELSSSWMSSKRVKPPSS